MKYLGLYEPGQFPGSPSVRRAWIEMFVKLYSAGNKVGRPP